MYIPAHYRIEGEAECVEFMKRYSFATIVTAENKRPSATHLPFVIEQIDGEITLTAHFAKANPQWKELENAEVLVIFQEPHAYISPVHYETEPNVPTWNYVAVHAYGRAEIIEKPEAIAKLIIYHEPDFLDKWNNYDEDYRRKMFNGIVAFKVFVEKLEGKKKLNQKSSAAEREKIVRALEENGNGAERALAEYMKKR